MARHRGSKRPPTQKKPPLTHFLCLSLVAPKSRRQLETSLQRFRDDVSPTGSKDDEETDKAANDKKPERDTVSPVVHPKAVRPVGALHCTLGVMSLDNEKLSEAIECLNVVEVKAMLSGVTKTDAIRNETDAAKPTVSGSSLDRPISPPEVERSSGPLTVNLKGLESMHSPQKTSILFIAPEDASGRLYPFCLALQARFKEKGLLVEDDRQLKLHATIVNTIYAKARKQRRKPDFDSKASKQIERDSTIATPAQDEELAKPRPTEDQEDRSHGHGPNANAPLKIDATSILEKYKDFVWAENAVLDRIAICEMGAKKVLDADGNVIAEEYTEVASIALPS